METASQTEIAVIDRFEGDTAVLLVGETQRVVDVPRTQLPSEARTGQWLRVQLSGERLLRAELDKDATDATRRRIEDKLARLRRGEHLK